jgi:hypothetical protein
MSEPRIKQRGPGKVRRGFFVSGRARECPLMADFVVEVGSFGYEVPASVFLKLVLITRQRESIKRTQTAKIYFAWGCFRKKNKKPPHKRTQLSARPGFIDENGGGPDVRIRQRQRKKQPN